MQIKLKPFSGRIRNPLIRLLIAVLGLVLAGRATAQNFTTLHSFTALVDDTNSDGASPVAGVILSGNTLYGTAQHGGSSDEGTVFAVNIESKGFTNLHNFTGGKDGGTPQAVLILSGATLYGTAPYGGSNGNGTVFAVNTNGTGFTNLYSFTAYPSGYYTNSDGANPYAGLILSDNTLYGVAEAGGINGNGTVFAVNTNGSGFTNLHSFTATSYSGSAYTNGDGTSPEAGLILSGNTLYGTAYGGGTNGNGTVFAVNTDGTGFTNLHSFTALVSNTNSDGVNPFGGLILSGNTLYGTAFKGGSSGEGTVFAVNTNGSGFTNLHSFKGGGDGVYPFAGLILSGNTLYGTASGGGKANAGTVFAVSTNGSGFTNLYSFTGLSNSADYPPLGTNNSGAAPDAGVILSGNTLYGAAEYGGSSGNGTVFSLSYSPQLAIIHSASNVTLTWPTNYAGFDYTGYTLQSTTNLDSPAVWTTNSSGPVVVNGQNTVTNPASGKEMFFRLSQ